MRHVLTIQALLLCPARSETVWRHDFRHNTAAMCIANINRKSNLPVELRLHVQPQCEATHRKRSGLLADGSRRDVTLGRP